MQNSGQLGWGKPEISYAKLTEGVAGSFTALPTPIDGTTSITYEEGASRDAVLEGGEIYASLRQPGKATFKADYLIAGADDLKTWFGGTTEGHVTDEYAIKIIPEMKGAKQWQLNRVSLTLAPEYTPSGNGYILHVTGDILIPTDGTTARITEVSSTTVGE